MYSSANLSGVPLEAEAVGPREETEAVGPREETEAVGPREEAGGGGTPAVPMECEFRYGPAPARSPSVLQFRIQRKNIFASNIRVKDIFLKNQHLSLRAHPTSWGRRTSRVVF